MRPAAISRAEARNAELIAEVERLRARVTNLLNANNGEVERRRIAEHELATVRQARDEMGAGFLAAMSAASRAHNRAERAERVVHSILCATSSPFAFTGKLSDFGKVGQHAAQ